MFQQTVLDNGLTVLSSHNPYIKSVTLAYYVKVGAHNEQGFPKGIAHFLEHMIFKGTKTRTTVDIAQQLDGLGAMPNAYTSHELTKYHSSVRYDRWKENLDIFSDMLWNSTFPLEEIESERSVILEEIKMYNDDPSSVVFSKTAEFLTNHNHNRYDVIGTAEDVKRINQSHLVEFVERYYNPDNIVVVATGNIDHNELVEFLTNYPISRNNKTDIVEFPFIPTKFTTQTLTMSKDIEQAHLCFALYAPPRKTEDSVPMKILAHLLGGTMSSRLFQLIRDDLGLAYTVSAMYMPSSDMGTVTGYVGLDKSNIEEVKKVIIEQLNLLKTEKVSEEELHRTKENLIGLSMMSMEKTSTVNEFIARNFINGTSLNIDDHYARIENVTVDDLHRVAIKYFDETKIVFAEVVPQEALVAQVS